MNRFMKIGLLMALVIALFGTYRFVSAQDRQTGPPTAKMPDSLPIFSDVSPPAVKEVLQGTVSNAARPAFFSSLGSGTVAIDSPTTVTCPGTSGTCTIEFDQNMQLTGGTSGDLIGFCASLDGSVPSPGCPNVGPFPMVATGVAFSQSIPGVPHGTHTVQSLISSSSGGSMGFYTMVYHVYKP
jgi:hypothetical protein